MNQCKCPNCGSTKVKISGGLVLDPFCGVGTTGLVALEYGRQFIGLDNNPEYVKIANKRLEPARRQGKLKLEEK
jgi:DNA modification methylase